MLVYRALFNASLTQAEIGVVIIEAVKAVDEAGWQGLDAFVIFSCDVVQVSYCPCCVIRAQQSTNKGACSD